MFRNTAADSTHTQWLSKLIRSALFHTLLASVGCRRGRPVSRARGAFLHRWIFVLLKKKNSRVLACIMHIISDNNNLIIYNAYSILHNIIHQLNIPGLYMRRNRHVIASNNSRTLKSLSWQSVSLASLLQKWRHDCMASNRFLGMIREKKGVVMTSSVDQ